MLPLYILQTRGRVVGNSMFISSQNISGMGITVDTARPPAPVGQCVCLQHFLWTEKLSQWISMSLGQGWVSVCGGYIIQCVNVSLGHVCKVVHPKGNQRMVYQWFLLRIIVQGLFSRFFMQLNSYMKFTTIDLYHFSQ